MIWFTTANNSSRSFDQFGRISTRARLPRPHLPLKPPSRRSKRSCEVAISNLDGVETAYDLLVEHFSQLRDPVYAAEWRTKFYDKSLCHSPIEQLFWHHVQKTRLMCSHSKAQKEFGRFRVDAAFEIDGRTIIVELDGKRFHDQERDWHRDTELLHVHGCDEIIRIPGSAIWHFPRATFRVLQEWHPRFEIPEDMYVCSIEDFDQERQDFLDDRENSRLTEAEFLQDVANYELWSATYETRGIVGSPKAHIFGRPHMPIITRRIRTREANN